METTYGVADNNIESDFVWHESESTHSLHGFPRKVVASRTALKDSIIDLQSVSSFSFPCLLSKRHTQQYYMH